MRSKYNKASVVFSLCMLIVFFFHGEICFASRSIPDDNLGYPVLVSKDGNPVGTGFFVNTKSCTYFITAKHVLIKIGSAEPVANNLELMSYSKDPTDDSKNIFKLDMSILNKNNNVHIHKSLDVVSVLIGRSDKENHSNLVEGISPISIAKLGIVGIGVDNIKKLSDVLIANDVYVFGFPSSIGIKESPRFDYDRPLLRKGIVAGKSINLKSIVLDTPSYQGNSGGPVLEVENEGLGSYKIRLIGVIVEFIPYVEEWQNIRLGYRNVNIFNSNYSVAIPGDAVLDLINGYE
jgi:hypothetical protein